VLSLLCSGTVQVWWMMNAKSMASHSRHVVQRLQSSVISFWAPSQYPRAAERRQRLPVLAATGTHTELPRVDTCRQWYTACTIRYSLTNSRYEVNKRDAVRKFRPIKFIQGPKCGPENVVTGCRMDERRHSHWRTAYSVHSYSLHPVNLSPTHVHS